MPRNGSGVYTAPASSFNPAVTGNAAAPADWNAFLSDLSSAVSQSIATDGQTTITANLPMATFRHTGVGNAAARTDYAAAAQIADGTITYAVDTGAADAYAIAPTPALGAYLVGQTFHFKVINANLTTTPTLAVSGLTAGLIKWPDASALAIGDLPANALVAVTVSAATPVFHLQTVAKGGAVATAIQSSVLTTRGDIIARSATVPARLAVGTLNTFLRSDGTDPAWAKHAATTTQVFTSGTAATYTTPAGVAFLRVRFVGAGGGGGGVGGTTGPNGATGGTTTFNSVNAVGGGGGVGNTGATPGAPGAGGTGGTGTATLRVTGQAGGYIHFTGLTAFMAGPGGNAPVFGGGAPPQFAPGPAVGLAGVANTGGGGGGALSPGTVVPGASGGGGEYVELTIGTPAATYVYTVGAAGAGGIGTGSGAATGGAGGAGLIIVDEFY